MNVHKTFRRRPGRLLNVLCTFNLRPVSIGSDGEFSISASFEGMSSLTNSMIPPPSTWFPHHQHDYPTINQRFGLLHVAFFIALSENNCGQKSLLFLPKVDRVVKTSLSFFKEHFWVVAMYLFCVLFIMNFMKFQLIIIYIYFASLQFRFFVSLKSVRSHSSNFLK